jgi:hypothetical protein
MIILCRWGWLGFNCGSTFGISGGKWKIAARLYHYKVYYYSLYVYMTL